MTDEKNITTGTPLKGDLKVEETKTTKPEPEEKANTQTSNKKEKETKNVEIPTKFKKLVEEIEKMSVLELSELVKILEEKFGVSASMAVAAAPAGAGGDDGTTEKTSVDVILVSGGQSKIQVIKAIKELMGKGLKEAKDLVDGVPQTVAKDIEPEEAEKIKTKLEESGATVEIK